MSKWHNAKKEQPELIYREAYEEPGDPDYFVLLWSENVLVVAEDEIGCRCEKIAHFTKGELSGDTDWEYYDDCYGCVNFSEKRLTAIKWTTDIPKRIKMEGEDE